MKNSFFFISFLFCICSAQSFAAFKGSDDSTKAKKARTEYEVSLLEGINTERSEFCAVSYSNGIAFVTDQLKDLVNNESSDANGFPYVDIFSAAVANQKAEKIVPFSKKINGPFHDGPVSFNAAQTFAYLTRVDYLNKAKNFVNRGKLFVFEKKDHGWSEPVAFKYNNDSYSTGHASVSANGQYLFFVSDMPGGHGGKDLYVCRYNGADWDKPENLGAEVNTDGDEEFPFIREDGVLFFSSNGHKGQGGYDIFSATTFNGKWRLRRNEGVEINSSGDDFGIVYTDSVHGYFSSNRKGGPGGDDIYKFSFSPMGTEVSATVLLTQSISDPAKNMLIYLLNAKGKRIDSTRTNQKGFFRFRNLYGERLFMASVEPDDIFLQGKARFYLANSKGEIVRVSQPFKKGRFVFKNLPFDKTELHEIYPDDDLTLSGLLTYSNNPSYFIKNAKLFLVNSFGDVVDTAQTNELGYFVFKNLSPKQDYMVTISDTSLHLPAGAMVTLSDKDGRKLKSFVLGKDVFSFRLMSSDKSVLSELATDDELNFDGNTCTYGEDKLVLKPRAYKKIYLIDGSGRVIDSVITNHRGFFKFRNLDTELEYIASVSEDETDLAGRKDYYLVNARGHVVKVGYPFKKWRFAFRPIPADSFGLQEITPDNDVMLAGNLRYGPKGADALGRVRIYLANSNAVIIDSVVTNEYGCFSFRSLPADQNYMMSMNESDMKLPLNTKVILTDKNGKVVKVFYVGKDRFEYKVMSAEKNLLHDLETDDEDLVMKLNGYILDHHKKAMENVTLILFDSTGMQRQIIRTDNSGKFSFKNLKVGLTGHVEIITGDARDSVLFIADSKGRVYKELRRNAGGKFEYKLLDADKAAMGDYTVDDPWLKVAQMESRNDTLTIVERIFYATNDFKFDSVGQRVLDKTINVLKANPKLVIELGSHTDSRSNDKYNLKLSNQRAQFAVEYIISKGIDKARLKAVGYGETRLLNKCSNNVKCSDKEHALNRRTEFRITTAGEATPLKTTK